jgi:hypothetical protein
MLAACASCSVGKTAMGQLIPRDNALQVKLSHLFTQKGNQLQQILLVNVPDDKPGATVEALIGKRSEKFELDQVQKIQGQYYLPITPVDQAEQAYFRWRAGNQTGETFLTVNPVRRWQIFLVHNSHQDPGFLDLPSKLRQRFLPYIDDAMRFCEETSQWPEESQFRWNIEVSYLLEDYYKARGEDKVRQVMEWVKKGKMALGGLYCSMSSDFMSLETLHRSVYYATNRLTRQFGVNIEGAILDDVNGFAWSLVEVMAKTGLRYLLLGANGDRDNMTNGNAPSLFYLEGPEGSKILIWRPIHYVEGFDILTFDDPYTGRSVKGLDLQAGEKTIARYLDRHERNGYPFDTIAVQVASDFTPPFKQLSEAARSWNAQWAYPRLRLATLADFFHTVERRFQDRIPLLRGGAPDGWVDLQMGEANLAALGRRTEISLPDAERLSTLAFLVANGPARQDEFLDAYHRLILWEEHTIEWWDIRADIYVDESQGGGKQHWEEKSAHARTANAAVQRIVQETSGTLNRNLSVSSPASLVVWNPLSFSRQEIVRVPLGSWGERPFRLRDLRSSEEVPYQIQKGEGHPSELVFLAESVPSLGYCTYGIEPGNPSPTEKLPEGKGLTLGNKFYQVALREKDGTVASIFDKDVNREFVDPRAEHGFNGLVFRLHQRLTEREFKTLGEIPMQDVVISQGASGPVYSSLRVSGHIEYMCKFEHEIILYAGLKRIDFHNRILKKPVYAKESLHYAFPFAVPTPYRHWIDNMSHQNTYRIDVPGAIMQPDLDQIPGSSRDNYVSQNWVSISRDDYGVLWSSADAPLVQLGGIHTDKFLPWLTMQDDNWLARGWLYSLLMYNHWVVDVPIAQQGDYLFRYSVLTHGSDWTYNGAHQFGWSFRSPLLVQVMEGPQTGVWPEPSRSFLEISPSNVFLAGFKTAEDGDGVILRLYEGAGLSTNAEIHFHLPGRSLRSACACDAREQNTQELQSKAEMVKVPLKPFETATVRVR